MIDSAATYSHIGLPVCPPGTIIVDTQCLGSLISPTLPNKGKPALQFGSEISRFSSDLNGLGDLTSQPAIQVIGRCVHPPTLVDDWHSGFRPALGYWADPRTLRSAASRSMIRVVWPSPCDPEPPSSSYLAAVTDFTEMVSPLAVPVTLACSQASLLSSSSAALSEVSRA